jgi:hypothetical protein
VLGTFTNTFVARRVLPYLRKADDTNTHTKGDGVPFYFRVFEGFSELVEKGPLVVLLLLTVELEVQWWKLLS